MAQQFKLRMPDDLRAKLDQAMRRNGCSLNTEIVARLERSFEQQHVVRSAAVGGNALKALRSLNKIKGSDPEVKSAQAAMYQILEAALPDDLEITLTQQE